MKRTIAILFAVCCAFPLRGEEGKDAPPPTAVEKPACQTQQDNCRACTTLPDGRRVCSNIGIACQPRLVPCPALEAPNGPTKR